MHNSNDVKKHAATKALSVIKVMAAEGYTQAEIAHAIGYHRATVNIIMSKNHIKRAPKQKTQATSIESILAACDYSLEESTIVHTNASKYTYDAAVAMITKKGPGSIITYEEMEECFSLPQGSLDVIDNNINNALARLRNNKLQPLGITLQRCPAARIFKVKLHKSNIEVHYDTNTDDVNVLKAYIKQLRKQNQEYYNVNQELLQKVNQLEADNEALLNTNSEGFTSVELVHKVYAYQEVIEKLKSQIALLYTAIAEL